MNTGDSTRLDSAIDSTGAGPVEPAAPASKRFHALDGARSAAMLLGVFYHLPIAFMGGFGFGASPKTSIDNWLHSFRMPLFFMISGIFAAMMIGKHGFGRYFTRRWWRIGAPLAIALFAFAGLRAAQANFEWMAPPGAGPVMPFMTPGAGFGAETGGGFGGGVGAVEGGQAPPFVMPSGSGAGAGLAMMGMFGVMGMQMPEWPSMAMAERLFGNHAPFFKLEHLWFLWYLLIFVTLGPLAALICRQVFGRVAPGFWQRLGNGLYRWNLVPLALGLVSLPALLMAKGFMGWSLANPVGFSAAFPDFLFQFGHSDLPFYFIWFMTGWWLFRFNSDFARLARTWRWNLLIGIAGFAASQSLFTRFGMQPPSARSEWIRVGSFALYGIGSACTAFGLLGFFERFFNRYSRAGRYFTDTMLWVYLIHLPLIPYVLPWVEPMRSAWWVSTLAGMIVVTAVSLILYELIVRPTPLIHIFGPPQPSRRTAGGEASQATQSAAAKSRAPETATEAATP